MFAPLVEEVLFRGLLLGYLLERGVPPLAATGSVVAAFGDIHYYGGIAHIASGAVMSALLVTLRLRYDNLVALILTHSVYNLVMGLLLPTLLLT